MGSASEIDTLLKKQKEVGLTVEEGKELKRLWRFYRKWNMLYGVAICSFRQLRKGVMLSGEKEKLRGSWLTSSTRKEGE